MHLHSRTQWSGENLWLSEDILWDMTLCSLVDSYDIFEEHTGSMFYVVLVWHHHVSQKTRHVIATHCCVTSPRITENMSCDCYSLLCDITMYHRKYASCDRYTLLCDVTAHAQAVHALHSNGPCADTKKTLPLYCCMVSLRMHECVYGAVAWQRVAICCSQVGYYQPFRVTCFVHHQGRRVQVACFSIMLAVLHQTTWYHRPKESNLHRHIHENFKPLYWCICQVFLSL